MADDESDLKYVLLGTQSVGKTCLGVRFVQGTYSDQVTTIGASYMTKRLFIEGTKLKLAIWDTAGQERYRSMAPMYYRGAQAAIVVYEVITNESFERMKEWIEELRQKTTGDIVIGIAGNKKDLTERRVVPTSVGAEYAKSIGAVFSETSALNNEGIDELFEEVTKRVLVNLKNPSRGTDEKPSTVKITQDNPKKKDGGCC
ncbi:rab family protein [Pelomyxa schiedti]|nr:rab family protein [Pelomyxa schiedti]